MTLWRRLIAGLLGLVIMYLAVIGFMIISSERQIGIEHVCIQTSNSLSQSVQLIEMRLKSFLDSITLLCADRELFYLFTKTGNDGFGDNSREKIIRRLINTYFIDQNYILDLHLISKTINFGYNNITEYHLSDFTGDGAFLTEEEHFTKWYPTVQIGSYANKQIRPVSRITQISAAPVIRFVRKMHISTIIDDQIVLMQDNIDSPYFVLDLDPQLIQSVFEKSLPTANSEYSVIDPSGNLISGRELRENEAEYFRLLEKESPGVIQQALDHEHVFVAPMDTTRWYCIVYVPNNDILMNSTHLTDIIVLLSLASLLLLIIMVFYVKRSVRPVEKVAKKTAELASNLVQTSSAEAGSSEVKIISDSIESINRHVEQLMQENMDIARREQEATIVSLETQIVPHFLYNALNKIHLRLIESNENELADHILRLSSVFRYQVDSKMHMVFLYQDLHQLEQFIMTMQSEKHKLFSVYYDIEDDLYDSIVPKMFMQPFVENAIIHGFSDQKQGGIIRISGIISSNTAIYSIHDNGCGIDPVTLEQIRSHKTQKVSGCSNVDQRIQLLYGKEYGVSITSVPGNTEAVIRIPLIFDSHLASSDA